QAEDGIRDFHVTGVQTCALPIFGREQGLTFASPREMFDELRLASKGGVADYSGITYERIEENYGVFWPCPSEVPAGVPMPGPQRSEERRVGKEGRARWSP